MELTRTSFEQLLAWLHPDPEEAGNKYVKIRAGLVKHFTSHHCSEAEKLADITIDRVAKKLPEIIDIFVGERERYFHRVAYYVLLESRAKKADEVELDESMPLAAPDHDDVEVEFECLEKCMGGLSPQKEEVIRNYYRGDRGLKIQRRKELAEKLNMDLPILRVLALRIRKDLKGCIMDCLQAQDR